MLHTINGDRLGDRKDPNSYTLQSKNYFKLVSLNNNTEAVPLGSFTYKIQKYPSDIDMTETAKYHGDLESIAEDATEDIQKFVIRLSSKKQNYFSDMKAGVDKSGEAIHWTKSEVLKGYKVIGNDKYYLHDSIMQKSIIKIDYIVRLKDRFVELTSFLGLVQTDDSGNDHYINLSDNFMSEIPRLLMHDINEYKEKNPFKAVKRIWSLARYFNNTLILKSIEPLINSNLSLIGQVNADIDTVILMLKKIKTNDLPRKVMSTFIDGFKSRLSTIQDIPLDEDGLYQMIDESRIDFDNYNYKNAVEMLSHIKDYLLTHMNKATIDYLRLHNLWPLDMVAKIASQ